MLRSTLALLMAAVLVASGKLFAMTANTECAVGMADWPSLNDVSPDRDTKEALWGYAVPGLGMNARELPEMGGLFRANNPGVAGAISPDRPYTLEELAFRHAIAIHQLVEAGKVSKDETFHIIGMSMGGMVLSVLAGNPAYRALLPAKCHFHFLVTSPNLPTLPAVPDALFKQWTTTRPTDDASFRAVLADLLSAEFRGLFAAEVEEYIAYRRRGGVGQLPREFYKQLNAIRAFHGAKYFAAVKPEEATFVSGGQDLIFGEPHGEALRVLVPGAEHHLMPKLGHLINMEGPAFFFVRD